MYPSLPHSSEPPLPFRTIAPPDRLCRATVVVPARNEEKTLARTLDALRLQIHCSTGTYRRSLDPRSFEVLLLLNNCTDDSLAVATAYQASYPAFRLHVEAMTLPPEQANVGTARRLLMDAACVRLQDRAGVALLSTDADTLVAPDWIDCNLAAIRQGAEVVGGVIHLFPEELDALERDEPAVAAAYRRDRSYQALVSRLESLLDPDWNDPWPRHLQHFGASLACTPEMYQRAGGLPHVDCLEDMAFIQEVRRRDGRLRHCPSVHVYTSARLDGRATRGLSGQFRHWKEESIQGLPHEVDSCAWLAHRFRSMGRLRALQRSAVPDVKPYPEAWSERLVRLHAERHSTARFLELLDCDLLIEETFAAEAGHRREEISAAIAGLTVLVRHLEDHGEAPVQRQVPAGLHVAASEPVMAALAVP